MVNTPSEEDGRVEPSTDPMYLLLFSGQVVMHISTAYSNCHLRFIEEKFYKYPFRSDDLSRLIDKLDDQSLENITPT